MASEMPKPNAVRRRVAGDRSTDKTYASNEVSAIAGRRTVADSTLKPGQTPKGLAVRPVDPNGKNTDKYYRTVNVVGKTAQQIAQEAKKQNVVSKRTAKNTVRPARTPKGIPPVSESIHQRFDGPLANIGQLKWATDSLIARLNHGETNIRVEIANNEDRLLNRLRTALDLAVSQEKITEDQYRELHFVYLTQWPAPTAAEIPATVEVVAPAGDQNDTALPETASPDFDGVPPPEVAEPVDFPAVVPEAAVEETAPVDPVTTEAHAAPEDHDTPGETAVDSDGPVTPSRRPSRRSGRGAK